MKCPYCGHLGDKVVDSRESREGEVIRRRRECLECGRRFTSYERVDEIPYMVVKKDGRRERFERQKLIAGLLKACEKRPVSVAALEAIADRVEMTLQDRPEKEMSTADVGAFVMQELKRPRQGRLRAVRVGLPSLPRHRRVHDRAERSARSEGMTIGARRPARRPVARPGRRASRRAAARASTAAESGDDAIITSRRRRAAFHPRVVHHAARGHAAIEQAIQSGLPTTFAYDVELRRPSRFWFDKLVDSARIAVTVRYDNLTRRYQVTLLQDGRVAEDAHHRRAPRP